VTAGGLQSAESPADEFRYTEDVGEEPSHPGEQVPPATSDCNTVAGSAHPNATLDATVCGFAPGSSVAATLHSTPVPLGNYTVDAGGKAVIQFTVPGDFVGEHRIEAVGVDAAGDPLTVNVPFVVSIDARATARSLAFTGGSTGSTIAGGAALLVLGALLVLLARRRQRSATS
jgi:hypothetical protein